MSIQRFRTFEEAEQALWCSKPDKAYFQRVAWLWELSDRICPRSYPKGIFKYRTIQEANKDADRWITANARQVREERLRAGKVRSISAISQT